VTCHLPCRKETLGDTKSFEEAEDVVGGRKLSPVLSARAITEEVLRMSRSTVEFVGRLNSIK
jgi:hypothetical protein